MVINSALNEVSQRKHVDADIQYTFCDYLNISVCPGTEVTKPFTITVYNPVARNVDTYIRIPVSSRSVRIFGPNATEIPYAVLPVTKVTKHVRGKRGNAPYELVFPASSIPPLGLVTFKVKFGPNFPKTLELTSNSGYSIENKHLRLTFSIHTGRLVEVENLRSKIKLPIDQQFYWYQADGSGAYLFDPLSNKPSVVSPGNKASISFFQSEVLQEVHQVFSRWVSQTVRLYSNKPYAEFEYTVGPISPRVGKEVIWRFDTRLKTNGVFYTDANGREMQMRKRNYRPTWIYQGK